MTEMTHPNVDEIHYISDNELDSSGGEGVEVAPSNYSTDSTVSMETEDSHDVISDTPIIGRTSSSNFHISFSFLGKEEDIEEEVELMPEQNGLSEFEFEEVESTGIIIGEYSNGSTAEELDTALFDSDPGNNYEENRNEDYNGDEGIVGYTGLADILTGHCVNHHAYENWPIIEDNEEMNKRRKNMSRTKVSRVPIRQRLPLPLPRPPHPKQKMPRPPIPVPRKRRVSGRLRPSLRNTTSEGDMEQADEMGDEGEGDDGFVDGTEAGLAKRKTKKKLSVLIPSLPLISPPSSPSNIPISRRRNTSRKNRVKPKFKKNLKPTLASADISTQETTTPGPPTSDSDNSNNKEVESVTNSIHQQIEDIAEEDMSIRGAVVARRQPSYGSSSNGIGSPKLESSSRSPSIESNTKRTKTLNGKVVVQPAKHLGPKQSNKCDISSGPVTRGKITDKSMEGSTTVPLSSETSDTSDNEKKKKTTPPLSSISKGSPQLIHKGTDQENQRPRMSTKGTSSPGTFVTKRLSVAAMINQFDSSDSSKPVSSTTTKVTSPVIKRHGYAPSDRGTVKKPPPLNKPSALNKPAIVKPKPTSPIPEISPPVPSSVTMATKKPAQKTLSSDKKDNDYTTKPPSGSEYSQTNDVPPLPPKPKSPLATKSHPLPVQTSNGGTSVSSSSTSSLSSSSSSSVSKSKSEEKDNDGSKKSKQAVVRKSSLVRASSNSSLTGKTSTPVTKTGTKSTSINHRRPSPTNIQSNKASLSSSSKSTMKNKRETSCNNKEKSSLTRSSEHTLSTEEDRCPSLADNTLKTQPSIDNDKVSLPIIKSKFKPTNNNMAEIITPPKSTEQSVEETTLLKTEKLKPKTVTTNVITKTNRSTNSKITASNGTKEPITTRESIDVKLKGKTEELVYTKVTKPIVNNLDIAATNPKPSDNNGKGKYKPDPLPSVAHIKPLLRPIKSSPRRPPPDPPLSPPGGDKTGANKKPRPRLRSPPPPPPVSPSKNIEETDRENGCQSPRNYEEFVPSILRSNSTASITIPVPSPPLLEIKTKGEHSGSNSETTNYNARAYEHIIIPAVNPDQQTTTSLPAGILRTLSFSNLFGKKDTPTNEGHSEYSSSSSSIEIPPPLPPRNYSVDDPVISLPTTLDPVNENDTVTSSLTMLSRRMSKDGCPLSSGEDSETPPPLPSQPIPKRKSMLGPSNSPLLKRKPIIMPTISSTPPTQTINLENVYEEIPGTFPGKKSLSSSSLNSSHYETADNFIPRPRQNPNYISSRDSSPADSIDGNSRRFSASVCVSTTSGLLPVTLRRANSDKMKNPRIPLIIIPQDNLIGNQNGGSSLQRTPSMDILDDRMNQSVRDSVNDLEYSSGEEGEAGSLSPHQGLPQLPQNTFDLVHNKDSVSPKPKDYYAEEEQEPLYQYINHLDFTSSPWMTRNTKISKQASTKKGSNQLEIARQLSVNHRKLWCEQPEVIRSGMLGTMSDQERKLQEAIFEVITSEASYLRSLDVLREHFMDDPGMNPNLDDSRRVISKRQYHVVFSNVREIRQVSANFLHELRERQRKSTVIDNISDIIHKYAEKEFGCYISYCTNQVYQMREVTEMLSSNTMFIDYIKRLESHKRCQNLSVTSFLLLPMQRITRLPLLVLAILNRLSSDHPLHSQVEDTLRTVQKLVTACNDGARQMERTEELHQIHSQLNFAKLKPFPLVSISRRLERKGSLVMLEIEQRLFGKPRIRKIPVYIFAFTDYILITKRKKGPKGEITYKVIDYASKAVAEVEKLKISKIINYPKHTFGEQETIAKATWVVSSAKEPHSFLLILLENSSQKVEKYVFVCQNDTECTRWMESVSHPAKEKQKDDETIYETWDCPQVQAVYDYTAKQHDEISLVRGDIVKVLRKMADGWYEGEKLRDLQWGWFPSNFTTEIENGHTRARNLKERHRLLSTNLNTQQFSQQFSEKVK